MRYAGAGNKPVQKMTMDEKSSFFGMLDRIEKVVSDTYAREAVPTLVHSQKTVSLETQIDLPAAHEVASLEAAAERAMQNADRSNVIDVAARIVARGESADAQEVVKMGDNIVLERRVANGDNLDNRFPPEFYDYFELTDVSAPAPKSPLRVV